MVVAGLCNCVLLMSCSGCAVGCMGTCTRIVVRGSCYQAAGATAGSPTNGGLNMDALSALSRASGGPSDNAERGMCKRCRMPGHLSFQCMNFLVANKGGDAEVRENMVLGQTVMPVSVCTEDRGADTGRGFGHVCIPIFALSVRACARSASGRVACVQLASV